MVISNLLFQGHLLIQHTNISWDPIMCMTLHSAGLKHTSSHPFNVLKFQKNSDKTLSNSKVDKNSISQWGRGVDNGI